MNFEIRKIKDKDIPQLILLFKEFSHFEKTPEKMTNTVEKMKAEREYLNGFVALNEDEQIIGYATWFYAFFTWVGKSLYMDDLYVKQEYRAKGIGSKLINTVIDFAKKENCNRIRWQVSSWNKNAIEFYRKLGAGINDVLLNCDLILNKSK